MRALLTLDVISKACELAALAAFAAALIWSASLAPAPWSGPAVATAVGVSLLAASALLMRGRKAVPS